jgi:RNA polymerase sigma-70 factor (ECF subfamily)
VAVLLKREAPGLLAYFQRRVRPTEDAADLLSETMTIAWRRAEVLPPDDDQARMWLYGVARNTLSSHRRGQMRRDALADQLRSELVIQDGAVNLHGLQQDARVDELRALIQALPEQDREIFALHVWEGFPLAQVAQMLGVPAGTIRSRYSRARTSLRAQLERG